MTNFERGRLQVKERDDKVFKFMIVEMGLQNYFSMMLSIKKGRKRKFSF